MAVKPLKDHEIKKHMSIPRQKKGSAPSGSICGSILGGEFGGGGLEFSTLMMSQWPSGLVGCAAPRGRPRTGLPWSLAGSRSRRQC